MPYNSFSLNPAYALSPFCLKSPTFLPCHVALGLQRDIATSQYDVAHAFPLFLPQNIRFLVQPRRVGLPTRHHYLPIRRGSRFFALLPQITRFLVQPRRIGPPTRHRYPPIRRGSHFFALVASKYSLPTRATSHWTPNATSHTSNTTWRPPSLHKKPPALYGWLPIFFI